MSTLLLIAVLGQWTSAGWFADPPKAKPFVAIKAPVSKPDPPPAAPAPKPQNNLLRSAECLCPLYQCMCEIPCRCGQVAAGKTPIEPAKETPKLQYWRLADNTGQFWQWHDREGLIMWVKARNASPTTTPPPTYTAIPQGPPMMGGANCQSGACFN